MEATVRSDPVVFVTQDLASKAVVMAGRGEAGQHVAKDAKATRPPYLVWQVIFSSHATSAFLSMNYSNS